MKMFNKAKRFVALMLAVMVAVTFMPVAGGAAYATTKAHTTKNNPVGGFTNDWGVVLSTDKDTYAVGETIKVDVELDNSKDVSKVTDGGWVGIYKKSDATKASSSYGWAYTNGAKGVSAVTDFALYGSNKNAAVVEDIPLTISGTYYIICFGTDGRYAILPIEITGGVAFEMELQADEVLETPFVEPNLPGIEFDHMFNLGNPVNVKVTAPANADPNAWIGVYDPGAGNKGFEYLRNWTGGTVDVSKYVTAPGYYMLVMHNGEDDIDENVVDIKYFYARNNWTGATLGLSAKEFTYNGKVQAPKVTSVSGTSVTGTVVESSDPLKYIIKEETEQSVNVGTYKVNVTFGGYNNGTVGGTATAEYKIVAKKLADSMIGAIAAQNHTGSAIKPAVVVKDGSTTLKEGTDYTVTFLNNTNAGKAKVTVTGKGNYTGTATATFEIVHTHTIVTDAAKAPTCTETGLTAGEHCTTCDYKVAQTVVPALGHDVVADAAVAATCTETGLTAGEHCSRCDYKVAQTVVPALGHDVVADAAVAATCTEAGLTAGEHCSRCDYKVAQEAVPALGHTAVETVTKATATKAGKKVSSCSACGVVLGETAIKAPKITLSKAGVNYTGKKVSAPTVRVKTAAGKTIPAKYYTVTKPKNASKMKDIGRYTYTVKFKSTCPEYKGTVKLNFEIKPLKTTIKAPAAAKKAITVKWKAVPKAKKAQVTGYEVQIATNKTFTKGVKKTTVKGYAKTSKKVTGLKSKTKYFVKVRTYKTVKGVKIYSDWSAVKNCKAK